MKLVLASNNAKKLKELDTILAPLGWELVAQGQLDVPEADEPHCTFVENALAKARHAAQLTGLPALADDSRLVCGTPLAAPPACSQRATPANRDRTRATTRGCSPNSLNSANTPNSVTRSTAARITSR